MGVRSLSRVTTWSTEELGLQTTSLTHLLSHSLGQKHTRAVGTKSVTVFVASGNWMFYAPEGFLTSHDVTDILTFPPTVYSLGLELLSRLQQLISS